MVKMLPGYPLKCSTKIDSGAGLHVRYTMDSGHQKLRDFIETLTEKECDELYKMLKTLLEEEVDGDGFVVCAKCQEGGGKCDGECESENEVVFVAGPPEPLDEDDYEVMPPA